MASTTASAVTANVEISQKAEEIEGAQAELKNVQGEIAKLNERLRDLRTHEGVIQNKITSLTTQHRTIVAVDAESKAKSINDSVQQKEDMMRKLQLQMESLAADRDSDLTQLSAVMKKGVADGVAAGVKQISTNAANSRYDLIGNGPATGLSQDPLNQIEGGGSNQFASRPTEAAASSVDNIGLNRTSASPFVRPEDYQVDGDRPNGEEKKSAKFSDWRSPSRNATRIAQPPGGYSQMGAIFG